MKNYPISSQDRTLLELSDSTEEELFQINATIYHYVLSGFIVVGVLVGGLMYWLFEARLNGAVIASATFVVESNRKTVQHLEGGIVHHLLVKEGDYVERNQVVLRLDSTTSDINVDVLGGRLATLIVQRARIIAELNGHSDFSFDVNSDPITKKIGVNELEPFIQKQKELFKAEQIARDAEEELTANRVRRFNDEIEGIQRQRNEGARQKELLEKDVAAYQNLLKKGFTTESRVNGLVREIFRLRSADANLQTSQTRAANQRDEISLNYLGRQKETKEDLTSSLAEIEREIYELRPQYYGAKERQKRIDIVAPVSGKVVNLRFYTNGGVIRPGDDIMDIVPVSDELVIDAKVATKDVEKLFIGQDTRIRLLAYDDTDIPEAVGKITDVSADALTDERDGTEYYVARIKLNEEQPSAIDNLALLPGMPADVFINTGDRTAISYFLQPLRERVARTFVQ